MKLKGVGLVPARSGSKGFPNKNIAKINGVTLIEYAIRSGLASEYIDSVYISTDSVEYEEIAKEAGARSFGLRPDELASDTTSSIDMVNHFIRSFNEETQPDFIVLLQPTSPIRTGDQIDDCIKLFLENDRSSVVSVAPVSEPHPYKLKKINNDGAIYPFLEGTRSEVRRQDLPDIYQLTGAIYVASSECLLNEKSFFSRKTIPYICEEFVNVDEENDFLFLDALVQAKKLDLP